MKSFSSLCSGSARSSAAHFKNMGRTFGNTKVRSDLLTARPSFSKNQSIGSSMMSFRTSTVTKNDHDEHKSSGMRYAITNKIAFPAQDFEYYNKANHDEKLSKSFAYFVCGTAGMSYAYVVKSGVYDLLSYLSPSADVMALANIEVDLATIPEGTTLTVKWRGKPLFVRHRKPQEIEEAQKTQLGDLKDPETDEARTKEPAWLVVLGVCTHLGCVPVVNQGEYKGWFCPCHGSHYDVSGRIRKGPAPKNLEVPPHMFLGGDKLLVGTDKV